jgi:hypothetical protein
MAKQSIGKRVARAAATGGSRTRRGETPVFFYSAIAIVVIFGASAIGYSRYERLNPTGSAASAPTIGQTWHVAFGVYDCNTFLPNLKAQTKTSKLSFYTTGNGLIVVSPKTKLFEGSNANLGNFALDYPGLYISSSKVTYPGHAALTNGLTCNGKPATIKVETWSSLVAKGTVVTGNPGAIRFADQQLITVGLVPAGVNLPQPSSKTALVNLPTTQALATTTTAAGTTATLPPPTTTAGPTVTASTTAGPTTTSVG